MFSVQSGKYTVSVKFSKEASAPTAEEALAKILIRRMQ